MHDSVEASITDFCTWVDGSVVRFEAPDGITNASTVLISADTAHVSPPPLHTLQRRQG